MEVDHFNPKRKKDYIQQYSNLFLSTRHCNGAKRELWPSNKDQKLGARFLNCCKEVDYGVHILEDPDTHELVGVTPEGRFHVRNCDLNAPHLVEERKQRAEIWCLFEDLPLQIKGDWSLPKPWSKLREEVEKMIHRIPYLTGKALENYRIHKKAITEITAK